MKSAGRKSNRAAFSLIEAVTVLGVLGILMPLVSLLITNLMKVDRQVRDGAIQSRTTYRLGDTFRRDAHRADAARSRSLDDGAGWRFELPAGASIEYRVHALGLERVERDVSSDTNAVRRELFRWTRDCQFRFSAVDFGAAKLATLVVDGASPLRIEATFSSAVPQGEQP